MSSCYICTVKSLNEPPLLIHELLNFKSLDLLFKPLAPQIAGKMAYPCKNQEAVTK